MNSLKKISLAALAISLSGCGLAREKIAAYYFSRAEKIIAEKGAAPAEIEKAYGYIDKAFSKAPHSQRPLALLEELRAAAYNGGFERAGEFESGILKKVIPGARMR